MAAWLKSAVAIAAMACCLPAAGQARGNSSVNKFIPSFAVKYGGTSGWPALEEAARFDLIVIGAGTASAHASPTVPGNTWQVLKTLNPRLKLLLYEIGPGEYNTASWGQLGPGWEWIKAHHGLGSTDLWTALGARSHNYLQGDDYSNERLMLPGNAAWQQYWLDQVYAQFWGDTNKPTAIADGIFSDNTSYVMPYPRGWHVEGQRTNPDVPAEYFSGTQYDPALFHRHMESFFARAFPWMAAKNLNLGLNFGDMVRTPQDWQQLDRQPFAPLVAMEEGAFVHPWGGKGSFVFRSEEEWLAQVRLMRGLKHVRALMNVHGPVSGEAKGMERMDGRDATGHRAWDVLWYALASFLQGLNQEHSNAYLNFTVWSYTEFHWLKELDPAYLNLGAVHDESHRVEGRQGHVFVREFDRGWVVVNPSQQDALGVAVPQEEARLVDHDNLEHAGAAPLLRQFDLPAHRGAVLLKPGQPIGGPA